MKRKIALLLLSLCLLLGLSVPVLAAPEPASAAALATELVVDFSEDLMRARMGDQIYVRANVSQLSGYYNLDVTVTLTEEQKMTIKSARTILHSTGIALQVEFTYYDNAQLTVYYINETKQAEYQKLLEQDAVTVNFGYPSYNTVDMPLDTACGEETILFRNEIYHWFEVTAANSDGLEVQRGALVVSDDEQYYYIDYAENGTTFIYDIDRLKGWLITDKTLCGYLDDAMDEYYSEGLGVLESRDFSEQISKWFLIIVFVVLPAIALVVFVFLAIRAKTALYRKFFINLCAWSGIVLLFVGIIAWVVNSY